MLHDLRCDCGHVSEFALSHDEGHKVVQCEQCGGDMTRKTHKQFTVPSIQGDTVAGGVNYEYYDVNLQTQIKGKQHREEVMKRQGVRPHSPTAKQKASMDEVRYVHENAAPNEKDSALAALNAQGKAAQKEANMERINKSFAKHKLG